MMCSSPGFFISPEGAWLSAASSHLSDANLHAVQCLSTLRKAMHNAVDNGAACLLPSLRSAAESFGSGSIAVEGDWRHDPIWAAANLQFLYDIDTQQDPPRYAPGFDPTIKTVL